MRILDRYVLKSWIVIFVLTAIGFPVVSIMINMTDNLERLMDRGLSFPEILKSYVYALPENIFLVMPAAVLFATVFTVGNLGRHSELTAAKAGGWSFHRLTLPIYLAATLAAGLAFVVGELAPESTSRQLELQKTRIAKPSTARYNFVYPGGSGVGLYHPIAGRAEPDAPPVGVRAAGEGCRVSRTCHHRRQRHLRRQPPHLATLVRNQPTVSGQAASWSATGSSRRGCGRSPRNRWICWPSQRLRKRCATAS